MNLTVHFITARSSLIISCSSGPSLYYACWSSGEKEENVDRVGEGKEMDIEDRPIFSISKSQKVIQ